MRNSVGSRVRVRRQPQRGHYDRESVYAVLDVGLVAHVAFVENDQPLALPLLHARVGDAVYVHGSSASRAMRLLARGIPASLTVTLVDGLVLARSAFEHSANYRSVTVLGSFHKVEADAEKRKAFAAFTNKLLPGRWAEVRPPNARELRASTILALPVVEAAAKVRTGPPTDDDSDDAALDVWAGEIPLMSRFAGPVPAPGLRAGIPLDPSLTRLLAADE